LSESLDIGLRRELFVDDALIGQLTGGARPQMHHPVPREVALSSEHRWEQGEGCMGYTTVFYDEGRYRMYYKGIMMRDHPGQESQQFGAADILICYAESLDGIHWEKPTLGLHEFEGSKDNNIVWKGKGSHGFAVWKDTRPDCSIDERYKAIGASKMDIIPKPDGGKYLFVHKSSDGLNWTPMQGPKEHGGILDQNVGHFDSQNLGFWDSVAGCYRLYFRARRDVTTRSDLANRENGEGCYDVKPRVRDIKTTTSSDCLHWGEAEFLTYPGSPDEELYTSQITPYYRAPHILLGFPMRYVEGRGLLTDWHEKMAKQIPGRTYTSYTDGQLMSSRDGITFHRWNEAFLRPRMPESTQWNYGAGFQGWGIVETASNEPGAPNDLSIYVVERYRRENPIIRRYTLRLDGFVSINAPLSGGEFVTRPLIFQGDTLSLNMATSAAGSIRVELQDKTGKAIPGFALEDSPELFGNTLERKVKWRGAAPSLDAIAGRPVRLRFILSDADLYSFQFLKEN
jgi:hypothetical protein